jgi:hypothetical protein
LIVRLPANRPPRPNGIRNDNKRRTTYDPEGEHSVQVRSATTIGVVVTTTMVVAIGYGMASGGFAAELRALLETPWARVTLIDLIAGFLVIGAWVGWRESSLARAIPWWTAILITGNLAVGIYLVRAAWTAGSVEELLLGKQT